METPQLLLANYSVALVHPRIRPTVSDPVLGAGDDAVGAETRGLDAVTRVLQPLHDPVRVLRNERRILRVALVGAAPARIKRDGQGGRKRPVHARGQHFQCGDAPDPLDQVRVAGGAQPDVVREDRRPPHIAIPVDRVHAVQERDRQVVLVLLHRCRPIGVVHGHPVRRTITARTRPAAAQHGADVKRLDLGRTDVHPLGLRHLPDLLVEGHAREQRFNACVGLAHTHRSRSQAHVSGHRSANIGRGVIQTRPGALTSRCADRSGSPTRDRFRRPGRRCTPSSRIRRG